MQKNKKIDEFLEEYGKLVKRHNIDFATYPMFAPDGNGGFKIVCQTTPIDLSTLQKDKFIQDDNSKN